MAPVLLLALAMFFAAPVDADPVDDLAATCRELYAGENRFFGTAPATRYAAMLEATPAGDRRRLPLLGRLGLHQLILGRLEEARATFDRALVEAATLGADDALRARLLLDAALVRLQLAEERNCVAHHAPASCILPFAPEALHRDAKPAREAGDLLLAALALEPRAPSPRWLLNLARMLSGDYPGGVPEAYRLPAGALDPATTFPRLVDVAPRLGVGASDLSGGAVMDDFDGDGLLDLVSSTWDPCDHLKAFRNDGRGGFEEVSGVWGLERQLGGLNLVHADYDGDGALDLLVLRGAWLGAEGRIRNSLLRNDLRRSGRFVDVTRAAGLAEPAYPTQTAAWADYDLDGDLDLYVGNESGTAGVYLERAGAAAAGAAYPSQLFRNDGPNAAGVVSFTDVAAAAGVTNGRFAKGVAWGDYDDDGDPDLYVSNAGVNRLYRNDAAEGGAAIFTDVAVLAGVAAPRGLSFATGFLDVDNDGDLDLFVADYAASVAGVLASYLDDGVAAGGHPVLYRNDGGTFRDVSTAWGLTRPLLPMGANFGDLDGDGWLDLYLGTGVPDFDALMPNVLYRNDRGARFLDATAAAGLGHLQKGHGVAFGDVDGDGDLDLFQQLGGAYPYDAYPNALYENPGDGHRWLVLELRGADGNRFALGARLELRLRDGEEERAIHRVVGGGLSFGGSSLRAEIGLGACDVVVELVVRWPGGRVERFRDVPPDRAYRLVEGSGRLEPRALPGVDLGAPETPVAAPAVSPGSGAIRP